MESELFSPLYKKSCKQGVYLVFLKSYYMVVSNYVTYKGYLWLQQSFVRDTIFPKADHSLHTPHSS